MLVHALVIMQVHSTQYYNLVYLKMYCVPCMNRLNNVRTISQTLQNKLVVLVTCLVTVGYHWLLWLLLYNCDYQCPSHAVSKTSTQVSVAAA